jgi:hypothetical protein
MKKKYDVENANISTKRKLDLTNLGIVKSITPPIT